MRIDVVCFTARGHELALKLRDGLAAGGDEVGTERCGGGGRTLREWVDERFSRADGLVFIGAAGIAVRAVAPKLASKTSDPAVVVADEAGRFAVSLLSGHIGGANALAGRVAAVLGATPVVTTATDVNGVLAIDAWAAGHGLAIRNPERIKTVSAKLLAGDTVTLESAFPVVSPMPCGYALVESRGDILVDVRVRAGDRADALHLVPRVAALGVGCRRGMSAESVERAFSRLCDEHGIAPEAFAKVCSVDLKMDEFGLLEFCARHRLPFETFSPEALAEVEGDFASSAFVESVVGVGNVCERSAVAGCGGRLIVNRVALNGITMAVAVVGYVLDFGDGVEGVPPGKER